MKLNNKKSWREDQRKKAKIRVKTNQSYLNLRQYQERYLKK